jgi:hypothetical protein
MSRLPHFIENMLSKNYTQQWINTFLIFLVLIFIALTLGDRVSISRKVSVIIASRNFGSVSGLTCPSSQIVGAEEPTSSPVRWWNSYAHA